MMIPAEHRTNTLLLSGDEYAPVARTLASLGAIAHQHAAEDLVTVFLPSPAAREAAAAIIRFHPYNEDGGRQRAAV
jgi:hypothetical protein